MATEPEPISFDIVDLIGDAWATYRAHAWQFSIASLVILFLINATGYFYIAGILLAGPFVMGLFKMALCAVRKEEVRLSDAFCGFDYFVSAVFLNLLIVLFSLPGLPFCAIPGIYMFILCLPAYFFLLDGTDGFWASLTQTHAMIRPRLAGWLWIATYFFILILAGIFFFLIGLVVTLPIAIISLAFLYDRYIGGPTTISELENEATPS
jgi:uncharacterized membrane protein